MLLPLLEYRGGELITLGGATVPSSSVDISSTPLPIVGSLQFHGGRYGDESRALLSSLLQSLHRRGAQHSSVMAVFSDDLGPSEKDVISMLDEGCASIAVSPRVAVVELGALHIDLDSDSESDDEEDGDCNVDDDDEEDSCMKQEREVRDRKKKMRERRKAAGEPTGMGVPKERIALCVTSMDEVRALSDDALSQFSAVILLSKGANEGRINDDLAETAKRVGIRWILTATSPAEAERVCGAYDKMHTDIRCNLTANTSAASDDGGDALRTWSGVGALLGRALHSCSKTDREDKLIATVVADSHDRAMGLVYSSKESIEKAVETMSGVYWSRSRNSLWHKGETSGDTQRLVRIDLDCDRDALKFRVTPEGSSRSFCHRDGCESCFGETGSMHGIASLFNTVADRKANAPEGSYTAKLFASRNMLNAKVVEEAHELIEEGQSKKEVAFEAADLLYFVAAVCAREGVSLDDVEASLVKKAGKVTRRPGVAKKKFLQQVQ